MVGPVTVLFGPSGAGKGTLIAALVERLPDARVAVSATTRSQRPGERHGEHYYFLTPEEFAAEEAAGCLLESTTYAGHQYGTLAAELQGAGHTIVECDVRGVEQLRLRLADARYVFIAPPSLDELARRLQLRGTETESQIARRIARAREELATAPSLYDEVIVNDDLSAAVARLVDLLAPLSRAEPAG